MLLELSIRRQTTIIAKKDQALKAIDINCEKINSTRKSLLEVPLHHPFIRETEETLLSNDDVIQDRNF